MPIDKRATTAAEALAGIRDGATVLISGFGGAGFPNNLIRALREAGPRNLTLVVNSATHRYSFTGELIEAGMVAKVICSAARGAGKDLSAFERLWAAGTIELQCLPQGTFAEAIRAGGAGIPAFYTAVGVGTDLAKGKEVRTFEGREYVLEPAIKGDLALIRADRADRYGNLAFRYAQASFGPAMATAAGLAVAEVNTIASEPMAHTEIDLPGTFVDRVLAAPMVWP
jgi:3-oxoacid CoA-transferase A subunit